MEKTSQNILYQDKKLSDREKTLPLLGFLIPLGITIFIIIITLFILAHTDFSDHQLVLMISGGISTFTFTLLSFFFDAKTGNNYNLPLIVYEDGILMPAYIPPRSRGFIPNESIKRIYPYWRLSNDEEPFWIGLESLMGAIGKLLIKEARHKNKIPWMMGVVVEDVNGRKLRIGGRSENMKRLNETITFLKERFPDKFYDNYYELDKWDIYGFLVGLWGTGMFLGCLYSALYFNVLSSFCWVFGFFLLMFLFVAGCGFSAIIASKQQRIWGEQHFGKENCHR